jgi:hypothetical protein
MGLLAPVECQSEISTHRIKPVLVDGMPSTMVHSVILRGHAAAHPNILGGYRKTVTVCVY